MDNENQTPESGSRRRGGKFLSALCSILGTLILLLIIAVCIPVTVPKLMGYEIYNVVSGSMEPEIPVGSVIYVKAVSPETVEEGDIIAFTSGVSVISHRVVSNQTVEGKFTTKGDANAENDMNPVGYADLIGRVEFHLPVLGSFLAILTSTIGKVYVLTLGACGVMLNILAGRMRGRV